MTVAELFEYVDVILENPFPDNIKRKWLNQIEAEIQVDVLLLAPDGIVKYGEEDNGAELIAPAPYDELYSEYLFWRICLAQHENELADNYAATFNRMYNEYVRFVCETINPGCGMAERLRYYLTAYQIAVKHGYSGSETEWLESLKGAEGKPGAGLHVLGMKSTAEELPAEAEQGDGYLVGTTENNELWVFDGTQWFNAGRLRGEPGYTPVKGTDYWTPEEQAEMENAKTNANSAAQNANSAAKNADTAADEANASARNADAAATSANEAATAARKAEQSANNAAEFAHMEAETVSALHKQSVASLGLKVDAAEAAAKAAEASAANAASAAAGKVDSQQGAEHAGKVLGIGDDGLVKPVNAPSGGVGTDPNAVQVVDELPPANDDAPDVVYLVDDETDGESGGITEETDPTVPDWAKQPKKPTYTAEEVGALSKDTVIPTVPNALPNPHKLKFTGAVNAEYDGSSEVFVEIPEGSSGSGDDYTLPVASPKILGGVMPEAKSDEMTQPVGVDALGALWTMPGAFGGGRVIETLISDVITEEGVTTYQRNLTSDEVKKINNATFVRLTLNTNQSAVVVSGVNFYLWSNYAHPLGSIGTINFGTGSNTRQIAMLTAELAEDRKSGLTCAAADLPGVNSYLNIVRLVGSVNDSVFRVHSNSNLYAKTTTETGFPVGTTFTLEVG